LIDVMLLVARVMTLLMSRKLLVFFYSSLFLKSSSFAGFFRIDKGIQTRKPVFQENIDCMNILKAFSFQFTRQLSLMQLANHCTMQREILKLLARTLLAYKS